jgi:hypothetical protein
MRTTPLYAQPTGGIWPPARPPFEPVIEITGVEGFMTEKVTVNFNTDVNAADFPVGWLSIDDEGGPGIVTAVTTSQAQSNVLNVVMTDQQAYDDGSPYNASAGPANMPLPQTGEIQGI